MATITATATDNVGVVSATLSFTTSKGYSNSVQMTQSGNTWTGPFGPVSATQITGASETVSIVITARDAAGNAATAPQSVGVVNAGCIR